MTFSGTQMTSPPTVYVYMYLIHFQNNFFIKMCFPKIEFLQVQTRFKHSLPIVLRWNKLHWHQQRLHNNCTEPNLFNIYLTFLIFISQKILLNIKDVWFHFRMGSMFFLLPFLWIRNLQFTNCGFLKLLFFKISQISLFWSPPKKFIIGIFLKLHLHTNMDEITLTHTGWAWKFKKTFFLPFLAA